MPFGADRESPSLLTLSETARRARISRRQVRNAIAAGELIPVFLAGRAWINEAECEAFRRQLQSRPGVCHAEAVA